MVVRSQGFCVRCRVLGGGLRVLSIRNEGLGKGHDPHEGREDGEVARVPHEDLRLAARVPACDDRALTWVQILTQIWFFVWSV